MAWSLTIGRFGGTAVRIHLTLILFLAWIWISAWTKGGAAAGWTSLVFIALIFACVVCHEFGHILAARHFGIETPEVILLPIGGVAAMPRMPSDPVQELIVALAGPLVNVIIGLGLLLAVGSFDAEAVRHIEDPHISLPLRLAVANLFLAAFNLIPAFPMDGGRVLHALLAIWLGAAKATEVAAKIGQGLAVGLGFLGLYGNPMLLLIAVFIYLAATGEAQMSALQQSMRGLKVSDLMERQYIALPADATLAQAVDALIASAQHDFPVVDGHGKPMGVLVRSDILSALKDRERTVAVMDVIRAPALSVSPSAPMDEALARFQASSSPSLCVVDANGALVGLVPRQTLAEAMLIRSARPDWKFGHTP